MEKQQKIQDFGKALIAEFTKDEKTRILKDVLDEHELLILSKVLNKHSLYIDMMSIHADEEGKKELSEEKFKTNELYHVVMTARRKDGEGN